jgi:hypothetical protein
MTANSESENRFLDVSEKEMVSGTRSPEIEQQSIEELRALTHRLRQAHGRAKDISMRQQREIRGKGESTRCQAGAGQHWLFGKSAGAV